MATYEASRGRNCRDAREILKQRITTFFDPRMSVPSGSYSPSGEKPSAVVADWLEHHLIEVASFEPASNADLELAHCLDYIRAIFAGNIANGHHNYDLAVAESTRWTVGSMVAAAIHAVTNGTTACSPSSGFHHAGYDTNHGFCTFNGLIVASRKVLDLPGVESVGILDCDWHPGDGSEQIIERLGLSQQIHHCSSGLLWIKSVSGYFDWLEDSLQNLLDREVSVVLYQAGADAHRDDPLGGLLNDSELLERDQFVFTQMRKYQIPVAWNLAGGYQREADGSIEKVLSIHRNTMKASLQNLFFD